LPTIYLDIETCRKHDRDAFVQEQIIAHSYRVSGDHLVACIRHDME